MLEGLEAVELNLGELEKGLRMDSELYKRDLVRFERKIKKINHTKLGDEVKLIKKGIFDIKSSCYTEEGIPFVRISNLKNCLIDTDGIIFIPEGENEKNRNTFLVKNDIILSKTANAAASLVNIPSCNVSQDTVAIKLKSNSKLNSHFTVLYLNTKYGLKQMQRWFTGNIQMHLNLEDCKNNLQIPVYSKNFQENIKSMFEDSIEKRRTSQLAYTATETLLLETLGLKDFEHRIEGVNVKSFRESFLASGRLDAEYYQKKFDELDAIIRSTQNWDTLGNILTFNSRGKQPTYGETGYPVINSKHVRVNKVIVEDLRFAIKEENTNFIKKGDVLINGTGVGTIGRAASYLYDEPAIPDNHVTILRTKKVSSIYLSVFLNSLAGQYQVEKYFKGSSGQIELYPDDINKFLIWLAPDEIQNKIEQAINQAFKFEKQSEQLLETAKRAVEIAIEQDEDAAMRYIEEARMASM